MTQAIYAASLDPIHYGHIDVIARAAKAFDEIIVAIGVNPEKKDYTFSLEERVNMAEKSLSKLRNVKVESFNGLLVDYAFEKGINVVVKGARDSKDFDYEKMLHQIGESQKLGIDSYVLFARPDFAHFSSSVVKSLQKYQGNIREYVPICVKQKLEEKLSSQYIIGITGEMGSGKSFVSKKFVEIGNQKGLAVHNIELDNIGHEILGKLKNPRYMQVRNEIIQEFGESVKLENGFINRKALGEIVFNDGIKLKKLNEIMQQYMLVRLRREISDKKGLF